ncbi:DUF961 domain-containing protein [Streptococcus chenjunshii]|uniref:DUF961 domain-containing protein n=1 Tax=Streptococcus chenjunshii TaxID=2173853 RepID=A0A372KL57_9STRE|nr:DUF961 family protein [Streptococcus chenjunshii]AXQ77766.1 DUF961 domain-containing protein [Streptococcus chenjunshii]RFU50488.1 DUF961 domain-containing protein [Streptococcus chenjunshii]RFU52716.1 DUF961 domain-containing protein [Streptococcus chenjunshii]
MAIKYAADVINKFDVVKTLGTLNFLENVPVKRWEDYVDENTGEERRRETDIVDYIDVKLYSSVVNGNITVTVSPEAKVAQMTPEKNYNDVVNLVNPTARFWSNSEVVNNRRVVTSGVKLRAADVVRADSKDKQEK